MFRKMKNIFEQLTDLLKKDERLVSQDGVLLKNQTQELARKNDPELIKLLLSDKTIKQHFFFEIEKTLIFDKEKFIRFVSNKQFLPDSYTSFKNKIGLTAGDDYLSESNEVVLVWPYKDCILEGGMTKEDQKRDEIFYNEILAPDDINCLLNAKVFTNFKRIDKKGEHKLDGFKRNEKGTIKDSLIIKGNNLLALASLKKEFAGKIKLIYIDPPYNTGSDSFGYNDNFNHSTWLVFMENRLRIAKELLSDTGVILVQCDDNEQAYLKVLMDEIFHRDNFVSSIAIISNPGGRDYGGIARTHEYVLLYAKTTEYEVSNYFDKDKKMPFGDKIGKYDLRELRNRNIKFNDKNRPNLCYPFYINSKNIIEGEDLYKISLTNKKGWIELFPKKSQGVQTVWRWGKDKVLENLNINVLAKRTKNGWQIVEKYRDGTRMARSVWSESEMRNEFGTLELKKLFGGKSGFNYPKSEYLMKRVIEIGSNYGDIILDYHIGSGTTCAVAHKMGRQYIGIEQLDYGDVDNIVRLKKVIDGEQTGISTLLLEPWKGGGDFVYMELAKWNEEWVEKVEKAKTGKELAKLCNEMEETAFLSYKVDPKIIDTNAKSFAELSIADQKKFLIECLDKNQLYVNLSEIEDSEYKMSKEDIRLNKEFYE